MPELPEVETVKETLKNLVLNKEIKDLVVLYERIIEGDREAFISNIKDKTISDIKRRGKYLIFELEDVAFYSHLRMEGKYFYYPQSTKALKHTHLIFKFKDDSELHYNDVRKFGRIAQIEKGDYRVFKNLGPEPFDDDFNREYVKSKLNKKPIKTLLLDQSFVAGVGNIYADEILFLAKINPHTISLDLSDKNIDDLIIYTRDILNKAIGLGGTTIRSYTSSLGVTGRFQNELGIHTKKECPICHSAVIKDRIGGRGTYYCPKCQK